MKSQFLHGCCDLDPKLGETMFDSPGKLLFLVAVCLVFVFFFGQIFNIDVFGSAIKYINKWTS
ncbi:hypothetical protein Pan258_22890 [Symmachiella dynata]|uniref:Uncharacterized protein n=1 Tax=Symmachiella dynata TaxID=2527995 RepID=A0A517ZMZ2_9PLAN|nr:hypothetical protein [Symmachiella dynata]QDT48248.1 hypothetical protein Pan258_22890 [Symmachiella dynata]QDU43844.1 hypothetical protein Mal52_23210 [Symmachiella dynata]